MKKIGILFLSIYIIIYPTRSETTISTHTTDTSPFRRLSKGRKFNNSYTVVRVQNYAEKSRSRYDRAMYSAPNILSRKIFNFPSHSDRSRKRETKRKREREREREREKNKDV